MRRHETKEALPGPVAALVGVRSGLAAATLLAPRLTVRVFGVDPAHQPAVVYMARLFGVRDACLALGLARLDAVGDPRAFLRLNLLVDLTDATAGLAAAVRRELSPRTVAMVTAVAAVAIGLDVAAVARTGSR
jgi:hypothetical protein